MKRNTSERGSALLLVIISAIFLIILTGAAYTLLKSSADTQQWTKERIQARLTAESGANLSVHMIMGGSSLPQGIEPVWFLGSGEGSWYNLPGQLGEVLVSIDPHNDNPDILVANSYEVRSLGRVSGVDGPVTFGFVTAVMPENIARFSTFQHDPDDGVFIGDGFVFDGPYYANGEVRIFSHSATHENDVFFYSFTTTAAHYLYGTNVTINPPQVTTPEYGNLQMRPINRHLMGEPWFVLNADPIPFGSDELNWQSVQTAASTGGLFMAPPAAADGMRMVIREDTLMVQTAPGAGITKYVLSELSKSAVWIDLPAGNKVFIKGYGNLNEDGLSIPLTIGTRAHIVFAGSLLYQNDDPEDPDNDIILGLMTVNSHALIAEPTTSNVGWDPDFVIATNNDLEVHGVVLVLDGEFEKEIQHPEMPYDQWTPFPGKSFYLLGGIMYQRKGPTAVLIGGNRRGHDVQIFFDPRLMTMHPPYFPHNGRWHVLYWEERRDMNATRMMLNLY